MKTKILLTVLVIVTVFQFAQGQQELNCKVTVNVDNIPSARRDYLRTFAEDVERYLNGTRWTDEDLSGEKIDCNIQIFFLPPPGENQYSARVIISSLRPVFIENDKSTRTTQVFNFVDDKWEFTYTLNQSITKDDYRFEPLASFLNYYAYVIIGLDLETYVESSGANAFQKAQNICNQAAGTSYAKDWQSQAGSYSRYGFMEELLNLRYQQFRRGFTSYHFDGLDLLATDKAQGLKAMLKAIESIAEMRKQNPRSILIRYFFDAKYREIADAFQASTELDSFQRLIAADPSHQSTYEEYQARRR
ncbi:MAG: DUF4835 family protein [bacterium]